MQREIERRVSEQLARTLAIEPNADPRKIIDIQIKQERERLILAAERFDNQGNDQAAELAEMLAEEWLPYLAKQLKSRGNSN